MKRRVELFLIILLPILGPVSYTHLRMGPTLPICQEQAQQS